MHCEAFGDAQWRVRVQICTLMDGDPAAASPGPQTSSLRDGFRNFPAPQPCPPNPNLTVEPLLRGLRGFEGLGLDEQCLSRSYFPYPIPALT